MLQAVFKEDMLRRDIEDLQKRYLSIADFRFILFLSVVSMDL